MEKKIFSYLDYKCFLKDFYQSKKQNDPHFSYQVFADKSGISSRGLIKLIFDGERKITLNTMPKIIKGLGLNRAEAEYFEKLVKFTLVNKTTQKNEVLEKILQTPERIKLYPLESKQFNILKDTNHLVIYALLDLKTAPDNLDDLTEWIRGHLKDDLPLDLIRKIIIDLMEIDLLKNEKGKIKKTENKFAEVINDESIMGREFFQQMIEKSFECISIPFDLRVFNVTEMAMDSKFMKEYLMDIDQFRKDLLATYGSDPNANAIYQFNMQLFKRTVD